MRDFSRSFNSTFSVVTAGGTPAPRRLFPRDLPLPIENWPTVKELSCDLREHRVQECIQGGVPRSHRDPSTFSGKSIPSSTGRTRRGETVRVSVTPSRKCLAPSSLFCLFKSKIVTFGWKIETSFFVSFVSSHGDYLLFIDDVIVHTKFCWFVSS